MVILSRRLPRRNVQCKVVYVWSKVVYKVVRACDTPAVSVFIMRIRHQVSQLKTVLILISLFNKLIDINFEELVDVPICQLQQKSMVETSF